MNSASLVLGTPGAGSGDSCVPGNARASGQCFHICLFISRKVMMDFYFTHMQICNKMPNSVRSYTNKPPFVLIASLNPEILPFLETVPLLHISTSVVLPACHPLTSLLIVGGYLCESRQPLRDSQPWHGSPGFAPSEAWPWESEAVGGPSLRPRQFVPSSLGSPRARL